MSASTKHQIMHNEYKQTCTNDLPVPHMYITFSACTVTGGVEEKLTPILSYKICSSILLHRVNLVLIFIETAKQQNWSSHISGMATNAQLVENSI